MPFEYAIGGDLKEKLGRLLDNERFRKKGVIFEIAMTKIFLAESRAHKKPPLFQLGCLDDKQIIKWLESVKGFEGVSEQYSHDATANFLMIDKGRDIKIGADLVIYPEEFIHCMQK